jgi:hypothetical protein
MVDPFVAFIIFCFRSTPNHSDTKFGKLHVTLTQNPNSAFPCREQISPTNHTEMTNF